MNLGKLKLLFQQAIWFVTFPLAILTNIAVVLPYGIEYVVLVLFGVFCIVILMMFVVAKWTLPQELNYTWEKCLTWQNYQKEDDTFKKEVREFMEMNK